MTVYNKSQLEQLWTFVSGPPADADVASAVALAESSGDSTRITNTVYPNRPHYSPPLPRTQPEYSVGLWQINIYVHTNYTEAEMLDPNQNARAAVVISNHGSDWSQWTTYTKGVYRQYLSGSHVAPPPLPPDPPTADTKAAQAHRGWHAINLALSRSLPAAIYHSERVGAATAKNLARRRK